MYINNLKGELKGGSGKSVSKIRDYLSHFKEINDITL